MPRRIARRLPLTLALLVLAASLYLQLRENYQNSPQRAEALAEYQAQLCAETLCDTMRRYRLTRYSELEL